MKKQHKAHTTIVTQGPIFLHKDELRFPESGVTVKLGSGGGERLLERLGYANAHGLHFASPRPEFALLRVGKRADGVYHLRRLDATKAIALPQAQVTAR